MGDFKSNGAHLFVDEAVGGEDDGAAELIGISGEIGDFATGFFDEEDSGGGVPGLKPELPKSIEAPCSDARQIQRRRAIPSNTVRAQSKIPVEMNVRIRVAFVRRKARTKKAGGERIHFGNENSLAIQRGASAAGGGE